MKYLRINESLDAADLEPIFGKITLPTDLEIQLANLTDTDGQPLIKRWLEPDALLMNNAQDMLHDRCSTDLFAKRTNSGGASSLTTLNGGKAIQTDGRVDFQFTFPYLTEWSIFVVAHATPTTTGATSSAILGAGVSAADANSFCPTLAIRPDTGEIRMFKGANTTARLVDNSQSYLNSTHLYGITLSQETGVALRVDSVEKTRGPTDKSASTISSLRWLGHYTTTGGHAGKSGTLIALSKDLSKPQYADELKLVETYFKQKYSL